jgi:hypothetical protein
MNFLRNIFFIKLLMLVVNVAFPQSMPVYWTELSEVVGDEATGTLTKILGFGSSWNSGAVSVERLEAGDDGWFEMTVEQTNRVRVIGFSDANTNNNYTTIDYALYITNGRDLRVRENGVDRGSFGTYAVGDRLGIVRQGGGIYYKMNDEAFYVSSVPSAGILMVDASLYQSDSKVSNVVMSKVGKYYYAISSGNWNDPNISSFTENGSPADAIPLVDDDVYISGFNVLVDSDQECKKITITNESSAFELQVIDGTLKVSQNINIINSNLGNGNSKLLITDRGAVRVEEVAG